MTIDELGFLSPQITNWVRRHHAENVEWFQLAESLNRVAHRQLGLLEAPANNNQLFVASLLFMRALSNFQGAIILAERGITQEARTIVRGCFENIFYIGALKNHSKFADMLIVDDTDRRTKIARALLKLPVDFGLRSDQFEKLTQFVKGIGNSGNDVRTVSVAEAARLAGLSEVYDTFYRGLSNDAAHPSITALNRHVKADATNVVSGLRWGPDVSDVEDTVSGACTACIYLVALTNDLFGLTDVGVDLGRCWNEYKRLIQVQIDRVASLPSSTP